MSGPSLAFRPCGVLDPPIFATPPGAIHRLDGLPPRQSQLSGLGHVHSWTPPQPNYDCRLWHSWTNGDQMSPRAPDRRSPCPDPAEVSNFRVWVLDELSPNDPLNGP